jgi:hypothetical protein
LYEQGHEEEEAMRRLILAAGLAGALTLLGACEISHNRVTGTVTGTGDLVTESRPVAGFAGVSVSGAGRLVIEQTGVESLEIAAEEDVLPHIQSEVVGDWLVLGPAPGVSIHSTRAVRYRLTVRTLTGVEASGASHVEVRELNTPELASVLSGASSLEASGVATAHVTAVSGASRVEAADLRSRTVTATVSGASYALVQVSDALVATASGGSSLEYLGDPVVVSDVSGGSTVRRVGP